MNIKNELSSLLKNSKPCIFSEATGTTVILSPLLSEGKSGAVQVTDHAVEDGSRVSDHGFKDPETISLNVFLADKDVVGEAMNKAKSFIGFDVDSMSVQDKIDMLKLWRDELEIVTYSGPVFSTLFKKSEEKMVSSLLIIDIEESRDESTGSGKNVSIRLKEIHIAQAMMKDVKLPTAAKSVTKKGQSSTKTEKVQAKPKSMLSQIIRG